MIFEVKNGCFSYKEKEVFDNINFQVKSGDLVAILGPNGIGKTTLIRCMLGFLKWGKGSSLLNNKDIKKYSIKELWKTISYVPQSRNVEKSSLTGIEYILLGLAGKINYFNMPKQEDYKKARDIMDSLSISHLEKRKMNEISGGELQLFLIARALISEPKLVILDEPESNLDFKNQIIVLDVLSNLAKQNIAVIFNTHYPSHALQRANKSLLLSSKGYSIFGNTNSIITENNLVNAFRVKTTINYIETDHKVYADVLPLEVLKNKTKKTLVVEKNDESYKLATISIIVQEKSALLTLNKIIYKNHDYIIGKMEMPYEKRAINIVVIAVDGPFYEIESLANKLSQINDICIKIGYSKGNV
ncbi:MAG: ATP-binding cassette domain-containing protein [Pleomorphochaeta sp.]